MKTIVRCLAIVLVALASVGCVQAPKQLYIWETFPRQQYDILSGQTISPESQVQSMEVLAEKARATGSALPPGFRAHLGMLHLNSGNIASARQMWQAEIAAFPESAIYIDSLLKRLQSSAPSNVKANGNPL